jgi:hypothetical protein
LKKKKTAESAIRRPTSFSFESWTPSRLSFFSITMFPSEQGYMLFLPPTVPPF